jgi:hypothetical protein
MLDQTVHYKITYTIRRGQNKKIGSEKQQPPMPRSHDISSGL